VTRQRLAQAARDAYVTMSWCNPRSLQAPMRCSTELAHCHHE
jgi:hypothetical protein